MSSTLQTPESELFQRELDHRLGNVFALFHALITASRAEAGSVAEFEDDLRGRLDALADAQSLGTPDAGARIGLAALCESKLRPFVGMSAPSITGPDVTLTAEATSSLALALHELATNAVKHGALSRREGRVEVRWQRDPDGGLVLDWIERDGPPTRPPERTSFGMRLIQMTLEQRLCGTVALDFAPVGLAARITLPATQIEADAKVAAPAPRPGIPADPEKITRDATLAGRAILIAEDDPIIALDFEETVCNMGARIIHRARTAAEAAPIVSSGRLHVAIVDLTLADGSAQQLISTLRDADVPLVLVSGRDQPNLTNGHVALRKPFSDGDLGSAILEATASEPA